MHLFYTPAINGDIYTLSEDESKHCIKVLRLQNSDTIYLVDGVGCLYTTQIIDNHPKRCVVKVVKKQVDYGKRPHHLHIAIAPTKNNDRLEWFLEKATEIGVDTITPLVCEHSERIIVKEDRLQKVVVSAIKQSIKAYLPVINPLTSFKDFIQQPFNGQKFIAHCNEDFTREPFIKALQPQQDTLLLIGPEGDFSAKEIQQCYDSNFKGVILSTSRLRTETAALHACSIFNGINEL